MRASLLILLLFPLFACSTPENHAESAQAEILAADRNFAELSRKAGVAVAFRRYMAYDALMLPDGGAPLKGDDLDEWLDGVDYRLDWQPQEAHAAASGDFGTSWGYWQARGVSMEGDPYVLEGKYLSVWRKNEKGEWKFIVDMGNDGPRGE